MSGRLLWIELRRNELLFLFPVVVALFGFVAWQGVLVHSLLFWADGSIWSRDAVAFLGPFAGAVAAWVAGRDQRHGLGDLIATTPRPALSRDLTIWAATALLGIVAFALSAAGVLGRTATRAAWDGPYFSVLGPGLTGIIAMAAVGYPFGRLFPRRVTALLVGAGLIIAVALPVTLFDSWLQLLSPVNSLEASPWYGIVPGIAFEQSLFLLGIAYFGLAGLAVVSRARHVALAVLVVAIVTSAIGVGSIRANADDGQESGVVAYEPVCAGSPVTICVHPAFEAILDELAAGANAMTAPFIGLDGLPTRFEQLAPSLDVGGGGPLPLSGFSGPAPSRSQPGFFIGEPVDGISIMAALAEIADNFLIGGGETTARSESAWDARQVVQIWMLQTAGVGITCEGDVAEYEIDVGLLGSSGFSTGPVRCDKVEQFAALDADTRTDWLRQNVAAIRAGEIELEDLP